MKVKIIQGARQTTCACGSWLRHWEKFSGHTATYCPVEGCWNKDLVGASVQKADDPDESCYIVAMCYGHSVSMDVHIVSDAYTLVSADKKKTCERSASEHSWLPWARPVATTKADKLIDLPRYTSS